MASKSKRDKYKRMAQRWLEEYVGDPNERGHDIQPEVPELARLLRSVAKPGTQLAELICKMQWKRKGQCDKHHVALTNEQWQSIARPALEIFKRRL